MATRLKSEVVGRREGRGLVGWEGDFFLAEGIHRESEGEALRRGDTWSSIKRGRGKSILGDAQSKTVTLLLRLLLPEGRPY